MSQESNAPTAIEQLVSRALRDNLERIQRTSDELHQAIADVVAACGSSKPANALPPMLRAQTSAASLSAALEVLSRFVAVTLQPGPRSPFEAEIARLASFVAVPAPSAAVLAAEPALSPPVALLLQRRTSSNTIPSRSRKLPLPKPWKWKLLLRHPARAKTRRSSASAVYRLRNKNYTAAQIEWLKFRCKILRCYVRNRCAWAASTKIFASDCVMTLRKLIENTTGASNPSWTTRWITFIVGWWKSLRKAIRMPSANIPTPRPAHATNLAFASTAEFSRAAKFAGDLRPRGGLRNPKASSRLAFSRSFFARPALCRAPGRAGAIGPPEKEKIRQAQVHSLPHWLHSQHLRSGDYRGYAGRRSCAKGAV